MARRKKNSEQDDILHEAREAFEKAQDAEDDNRRMALEDIRFARNGDQWPAKIRADRERENRPCLTINKLPSFIRQVVNDARQNKPSVKVHPVDSGADTATAKIMDGLIRNIEYSSNADVAYDTAVESAVSGGFGYWRIGLDYAFDDAFDMDIRINRISNPFSVYGDPSSREADSSDWDVAFITDRLTKDQYEREYGDTVGKVDWDDDAWTAGGEAWLNDDGVLVAEYWTRTQEDAQIHMFMDLRSNLPQIYNDESLNDPDVQQLLALGLLEFRQSRTTKAHKVKQRILSGVDVLKEEDWVGRYIPIVPVYGDEYDIEGKRYFRSLVHDAVDAQRMFNYWRTTSTELVALAPRVPYIGPKGSFDSDVDRWQTVNTRSHPYLEYDEKGTPPQRQPLDVGPAAGALQEALNASDDIKSIVGLYDASLGARSNETSGKAILARQREGDVSTFHFLDNLSRAIRHTGRILIDLIPKVYNEPRIIRVIGEDGKQTAQAVNQEAPETDKNGQPVMDETGQAIMAMHDLTTGKYDLTVTTGPSFTTRREEAAAQMTEMIRALPATAPVLGKHLAKNLDWPGADDIAEELERMSEGQLPPEAQKMIEQGKQMIQKLQEENQKLKGEKAMDQSELQAKVAAAKLNADADVQVEQIKIQSQERIAEMKIDSEMRVATYKAQLDAQAKASQPAREVN